MRFVHHDTGDWVRPSVGASYRTDPIVTEYGSLAEIQDAFVRQTFEWMLEIGEIVTSCGSNVFQIRS
jgi:hypothetical protein